MGRLQNVEIEKMKRSPQETGKEGRRVRWDSVVPSPSEESASDERAVSLRTETWLRLGNTRVTSGLDKSGEERLGSGFKE